MGMGGMNGIRMSGSPMGGGRGMGGMGGMPGVGGASTGATRQAPAVEHPLNLSLEDLYQGSSKRMRITRKVS